MFRPPILLAAVLALACLAGPAAAEEPVRYDGAGFALALPPGCRAVEAYTGEFYVLNVIRPDRPDDEQVAFLRLLVVPNERITPEALRAQFVDDLKKRLGARGLASGAEEAVTLRIAGKEIEGRSLPFATGGTTKIRMLVFSFANGNQRVAVAAKIDLARETGERHAIESMLADLEIREISRDSLIRVEAAGISFCVPIVTQSKWSQGRDGLVTGRLGLPEGGLRVFLRNCGTPGRAGAAVEGAHRQHRDQLEAAVAKQGGKVLVSRMTPVAAGDDLLVGSLHRLRMKDGSRRVSTMIALADGPLFVGFSFLASEADQDRMAARIEQVVGSFEGGHPRTRRPDRFVGHGVDVSIGSSGRLEDVAESGGHRLTLAWPGPFEGPEVELRVREDRLEETGAALHVRLLGEKAAPEPGRETTALPVTVFGEKMRAAVTTWPEDEGRAVLATVAAPLNGRRLVAVLFAADAELPLARRAFVALLDRLAAVAGSSTEIRTEHFGVTFDPSRFTARTSGPAGSRTVSLESEDGMAEVRWSDDLGTPVEAYLADRVEWALERTAGEHEDRIASSGETNRDPAPGRPWCAATLAVTGRDGRAGWIRARAAPVGGGCLLAWTLCCDSTDEDLAADCSAVLSGLKLFD